MTMPGRKYSQPNSNYRYGFNGQEKSDDVTAGNYTAIYWEYDSRTGRRWNPDPILKVWESPYSVLGNSPIRMVDPNGSDWYENNKTHKAKYYKGSKQHKGYTRRGDDNYVFQGSTLEAVVVTGTRKKLPSNNSNPEYQGWGEVRDAAINKLDKNIKQLDRTLETTPSNFGSGRMSIEKLEWKRGYNIVGKGILETTNTVLDVWDVGVGMHAYATKGADADIFSSLPLVGGVFSAANDLQDETERIIVNGALQNGYSNFYRLLTASTVGRRSGLTGVYISKDVLQSVVRQGYLDLNLTQIARIGGPVDEFGNDLKSTTPKKYDYFLVFPKTRENKVTQFIPLKIN
jgi:RHS repeat-associated protein